jgi:serine/threonine-protein kinase
VWAQNTLATACQTRAEAGRRLYGEDPRPVMHRAIRVFEMVLASPLLRHHVLQELGASYASMGLFEMGHGEDGTANFETALRYYQQAQALAPSGRTWYLMATPLKWLGLKARWSGGDPVPSLDRSLACYRSSLAMTPRDSAAMARLADVDLIKAEYLLMRGQDPGPEIEEAIRMSRDSLEIAPESYLGNANLGEALLLRAWSKTLRGADATIELREAGPAIEHAIAQRPGDPELIVDRALLDREGLRQDILFRRPVGPRLAQARQHISEVLRRNPTHAGACRILGETCLLAARATGAKALALEGERALDRAVALNPNLGPEIRSLKGP